MKLLEFKITPNKVNGEPGWGSQDLEFGDKITQLYGPNGSGKTPIVLAIVYALGYPSIFRDDIYQYCATVELKVSIPQGTLTLIRDILPLSSFHLVATETGKESREFSNEADYSRFLLEKLGLASPTILSLQSKPINPYMSTLLPLIYLDQDEGYFSFYCAPKTFIKDQFAEMVRIALDLPPANSFTKEKDFLHAKAKLDSLDIQVVGQKSILDDMASSLKNKHRSIDNLNHEIDSLKSNLALLRVSQADKSKTLNAMDSLIFGKRNEHASLLSKIRDLALRIQGIDQIKNEINTEIQTLSLNEEARRLFHSFKEICAADNCGLFLGSAESYGKNLLYLKDQIKDLEKSASVSRAQISVYETLVSQCESDVSQLAVKYENFKQKSAISTLLETVEDLTQRIIELEYDKKLLENLQRQEAKIFELSSARDIALSNVDELRNSSRNSSSVRLIAIRKEFATKIQKWLDILRTSNVSRDVSVLPDFKIKFGNESINQIKGSTRVRVVLAVHASLFELILENKKSNLNFLILDTPKQQEMHDVDISDYIVELKKISNAHAAQIVFSTTEYHFDCEDDDKEWIPVFDGEQHKMFLGKLPV